MEKEMPEKYLVELLRDMEQEGISVWLDGGWAVDALLGKQTRLHGDLDVVIEKKYVPKLRRLLEEKGYKDVERDDTREWNFVLGDENGHEVDFHVITLDQGGDGVYGPEGKVFPATSLTGVGTIAGVSVKCISPDWLVKFHTGYELGENDYHDLYALHEKFGVELPHEFQKRQYHNNKSTLGRRI